MAVPDLEVAKPGWEAGALYDTFKTNAGIVSARVDRAADNTEAALKIKEIILQTGAKKVVAAPSPLVDSLLPDYLWAAGTGPALHRKDLHVLRMPEWVSQLSTWPLWGGAPCSGCNKPGLPPGFDASSVHVPGPHGPDRAHPAGCPGLTAGPTAHLILLLFPAPAAPRTLSAC